MEKLKNFEIPNKKIEAWKFTDLKKVFEVILAFKRTMGMFLFFI